LRVRRGAREGVAAAGIARAAMRTSVNPGFGALTVPTVRLMI
jgi:hypothetical protein